MVGFVVRHHRRAGVIDGDRRHSAGHRRPDADHSAERPQVTAAEQARRALASRAGNCCVVPACRHHRHAGRCGVGARGGRGKRGGPDHAGEAVEEGHQAAQRALAQLGVTLPCNSITITTAVKLPCVVEAHKHGNRHGYQVTSLTPHNGNKIKSYKCYKRERDTSASDKEYLQNVYWKRHLDMDVLFNVQQKFVKVIFL